MLAWHASEALNLIEQHTVLLSEPMKDAEASEWHSVFCASRALALPENADLAAFLLLPLNDHSCLYKRHRSCSKRLCFMIMPGYVHEQSHTEMQGLPFCNEIRE